MTELFLVFMFMMTSLWRHHTMQRSKYGSMGRKRKKDIFQN